MFNKKILIRNTAEPLLKKLIYKIGDPPDTLMERKFGTDTLYVIESNSIGTGGTYGITGYASIAMSGRELIRSAGSADLGSPSSK